MGGFSNLLRQRDVERVTDGLLSQPGTCASFIVQGLPGGGIEEVLAASLHKLRQTALVLVELNLRLVRSQPVSTLIGTLLAYLEQHCFLNKSFPEGSNLADYLSRLRQVAAELAGQRHITLIVLDSFDSLLKSSEPDDLQHVLNVFQAMANNHDYRTGFLAVCHRDIEDICQAVNYSDFWKIFGTNRVRVRNLPPAPLDQAIRENFPQWSHDTVESAINLSGGYPELIEVIAQNCHLPSGQMERECLDALNTIFVKWLGCLLPREREVLDCVRDRQDLDKDHWFERNKLLRKGLLREGTRKEVYIASALFEAFLAEQIGAIEKSQNPFIRRPQNLQSERHYEIFASLFRGRFFLEWEYLQAPSSDNASVYKVTGEDQKGVHYRPCVVKIDSTARLRIEVEKHFKAKSLLGPLVPNVIETAEIKGLMGIVYEIATAAGRSYNVKQFKDFYLASSAQEIADLLLRVFTEALYPLYQAQKVVERQYRNFFFLPRSDDGEYKTIEEIARGSEFYDLNSEVLRIPGVPSAIPNPGSFLVPRPKDETCAYYALFGKKHLLGLSQAHGDLNPRNLLIDGIGNIHLIDFSEMKEQEKGCRFVDLVRLESEIKFKLTEIAAESLTKFVAIDGLLTESKTLGHLERVHLLPLSSDAAKMVSAVCAIRRAARIICTQPNTEEQIDYEYKLGLLAQGLRLALFEDYTSKLQREFAVVSCALLAEHLLATTAPADVAKLTEGR